MSPWPIVSLESIATIDRSVVDPRDLPEGTQYVGLDGIPSGGGAVRAISLSNGDLRSSKFRFSPAHVLFGKLRPYLAKVAVVDFDGVCSTDILPIRPGPELDRDYLRHFLLQPQVVARAASLATGANLPRLSPKALGAFPIPLPSKAQQQRIAHILDRTESARFKRRLAIARTDELTRSIFLDMFGDPVSNSMHWSESWSLGDVADITSGVTKGRKLNGSPTREVPYLAVVNVQDGRLDLSKVKTIEATEAEINGLRLSRGDLLLTEGGDPDKLGRGCLWANELPECIHQNHIFRVRLRDDRVMPDFLSWLIASQRGKRYFLKSAKQTTGIATINLGQLRAFPLIVPPVELQREFTCVLERIAKMKERIWMSMGTLDALFASLQHRAFRREL